MIINTKDISLPALLQIRDILKEQLKIELSTIKYWTETAPAKNTFLAEDSLRQMKKEYNALKHQFVHIQKYIGGYHPMYLETSVRD